MYFLVSHLCLRVHMSIPEDIVNKTKTVNCCPNTCGMLLQTVRQPIFRGNPNISTEVRLMLLKNSNKSHK